METPLSTDEFSKPKFSVYPNPAETEIRINNPSQQPISKIWVYDIYGKKVAEKTSDTEVVAVDGLASGIYFLTIKSEDSESVLKFIKK